MKNRTIKGKRYLLVPSIHGGSCDYCVFCHNDGEGNLWSHCMLVENSQVDDPRYGDSNLIGCNPEHEDKDFIFIKTTKAALAEYIAHKLEGA